MDSTTRREGPNLKSLSDHEDVRYCSQCGRKLGLKEVGDEGRVPFCSSCNRPFFRFSLPCILVTVANEREIVLLKQHYVSRTNWVLVAGLIQQGETAEETVIREVEEETGLEMISCKYISSYYHPERDLLLLGFVAWVEKAEFNRSKEVDDIGWFPIEAAESMLRDGSIAQQLFREARAYLE